MAVDSRQSVRVRRPGPTARVLVGLALLTVAASCSSDESNERAQSVAFVDVSVGDSWSDLVARVAKCDDEATIEAAVDYLRSANPILADVGLADAQVAAFDPAQLDSAGCVSTDLPVADANGDDAAGDELRTPPVGTAAANADDPTPHDATSSETTHVAAPAASDTSPPVELPTSTPQEALDGTNLTVAFEEDFAQEASLDRFRWQIHHAPPWQGSPETWQGDHDENCGPPSTTRTIALPPEGPDPGDTVYWCAPGGPGTEHLMTTFHTTGYAQVAFSPDQVFDDVARVCWNQNMTLLGRKWTQLVVVSEEVFEANDERLDYVKPSIEDGPGSSGVFLNADEFLFVLRDGSTVTHTGRTAYGENYRGFTTEDKARRYRTCLTDLENGTVMIELEREDSVELRELPGSMPDGPARVIFQDDTYNSTKRRPPTPEPFTWHWDDLLIETR